MGTEADSAVLTQLTLLGPDRVKLTRDSLNNDHHLGHLGLLCLFSSTALLATQSQDICSSAITG